MKRLFILLLVFQNISLLAQVRAEQTKFKEYTVFVVAQESVAFDLMKLIDESNAAEQFNIYYLADLGSEKLIADSLNRLLNEQWRISKNHLYLLLAGDELWIEQYKSLKCDLLASQHIIISDSASAIPQGFSYSNWSDLDIEKVLNVLKSTYKMQFFVDGIKRKSAVDVSRDKEKGFGLRIGVNTITHSKIAEEGYLPETYFDYAFNYYKLYNSKWRLNMDFAFTFKKPNPQKEMQEIMMSQVDMSAIISGSGLDEQEIDLKIDITGRFGFQYSIDLYYLFQHEKTFNPYLGGGLSLGSLLSFKGTIDTTITIDPSEISGGGGFDSGSFSAGGMDEKNSDFSSTMMIMPSFNFTVGFQHEWGRRIAFDLSAKYFLDLKTFKGDNYANRFTVNAGLLYRLTGKRKVIYKYF